MVKTTNITNVYKDVQDIFETTLRRFVVKAKERLFIPCLCYELFMLVCRDNLFVFDLRGQIRHLSAISRLMLYTVVHNCNGIYVLEISSITFIFLLVQ